MSLGGKGVNEMVEDVGDTDGGVARKGRTDSFILASKSFSWFSLLRFAL